MPWKEVIMEQSKRYFIESYLKGFKNFKELCVEHKISRTTGYNLIERYHKEGETCYQPASCRPKSSPTKTTSETESLLLNIRSMHPSWGGAKIRSYLMQKGYLSLPSSKTVQRILKKHGCIDPEISAQHKPYIRFEHEHPNDLWQMDFKGDFLLGDSSRCFPLTLLDDHSRYSLLIKSCENQQRDTVIEALKLVFREYGLPSRMTMDNGAPWGYCAKERCTQLTAWLIRLGIRVSHSRPHHPQTQGKLERFHRTLKLELLSRYYFDNLKHIQEGFNWWQAFYNNERPHEAIENHYPPVTRYQRSQRPFLEKLEPIEYDSGYDVRKVDVNGMISYKNKPYKVGKGLADYPVGIKRNQDDHLLDVYFCNQIVLKLAP